VNLTPLNYPYFTLYSGASVAEWLACWTQAQKARVQIAVATLSGNSLRQTVHTHCASVHQAAKLVAALLRVADLTAGLAESNGSLPSGLWFTSPAGWLPRTGISSGTLRSIIEYGLPLPFLHYILGLPSYVLEWIKLECSNLANCYIHTYIHTYIHPFNGPLPGLPGSAGTRKVKPIWVLLKQETVSGSDISWAICKSAPRSRQITTQAPHHSVFTGRMPFLPPNQQRQSTEGT